MDVQTSMKYSSKVMRNLEDAMTDFSNVFASDYPKYSGFKFKNDEDLSHHNPLIADLNSSSLLRGVNTKKYQCAELNHKPTMVKNFEDQIKLEKKFLIEVPSIFNDRSNEQKYSQQSKFYIRREFEEKLRKNFRNHLEKLKNTKGRKV